MSHGGWENCCVAAAAAAARLCASSPMAGRIGQRARHKSFATASHPGASSANDARDSRRRPA
jgi:hypothetical protein